MKTGSFFNTVNQPGRVSIARSNPRGMPGIPFYRPLNPTKPMMKMGYDQYRTLYFETILGDLDPQKVWDELHEMAGGAEPILLCWEDLGKPDQWCHRTMVAEWFGDQLGVEVAEVIVGGATP